MFQGFSPHTIDFMWGLRLNNEKAWFEAHKDEFARAFQLPMRELARAVFERITDACPDRGFIHKLSRIYRDARRLRCGEGPYRAKLYDAALIDRIADGMLSLMPLYDYLITIDSDPAQ